MQLTLKQVVPYTIVSGALIIIGIALGMVLNPSKPLKSNPPKIISPIVALELVESPNEIFNIIGSPESEEGKTIRKQLKQGFYADYVLITGFVFFNICLGLLLFLNKNITRTIFTVLVLASIAAGVFDLLEDFTLQKILDSSIKAWAAQILTLQAYTYLKWQLLGFCCLLIGLGLKAAEKRFIPALYWAAFILAAIGLVMREAIEWQSLLMGLAWLVSWAKSIPLKKSWWVTSG